MIKLINHDYEDIFSKTNNIFGTPNTDFITYIIEDSPRSLLDVGAGNGRYASYFTKAGFMVTAVEMSSSGCERIRETTPNTKVVNENFLEYNNPEKFDVVYSVGLIEDLAKEDQTKSIEKMKKLVRPGGRLCIRCATFIEGKIPENRIEPKLIPSLFNDNSWEIIHYSLDEKKNANTGTNIYRDSNTIIKQTIVAKSL